MNHGSIEVVYRYDNGRSLLRYLPHGERERFPPPQLEGAKLIAIDCRPVVTPNIPGCFADLGTYGSIAESN